KINESMASDRAIQRLFFLICRHTSTNEIYTLSLHDALPICLGMGGYVLRDQRRRDQRQRLKPARKKPSPKAGLSRASLYQLSEGDRKSTRLNSSHVAISYAVFCLKKKK